MKTVAGLVHSTAKKDSFADRSSWYVRFNGRSSIPLEELLILSRTAFTMSDVWLRY